MDLASYTERRVLESHDLHDSTRQSLNDIYKKRTEELAEELSFMKGRIIGLLEGNHFVTLESGITSTQYLCHLLGCKYLGYSAFIRLSFKDKGKTSRRCSVDLWVHHGKAGAKLVGGSLNNVEQMCQIAEADIYCVDETTEILTISGFKKIGEIASGDGVFSFNTNNNKIERDIAKEVIINDYEGDMYQYKNSSFDMLVSPNHRIMYRYKNGWLFKKSREFLNMHNQVNFPLAGIFEDEVDLNNNEIALSAWIIAEGSFKCSGIRITQKSEKKTKIIVTLLNNLGYKFTIKKRIDDMNIIYISKESREKITYVKEKNIPNWVSQLTKNQFDLFFYHLVLGDGHFLPGDKSGGYYSSNKDLMDRLQMALCIHGYRTKLYYKKGGFKNGGWVLLFCNKTDVASYSGKLIRERIKYHGKIWCINTHNTTMICRRNGQVFITGNCMGHDHRKSAATKTRLTLKDGNHGVNLSRRKILLARTGSFLKGYEPERSSYVAEAGYAPTDLGVVKIEMTPKREQSGDKDLFFVDLHCSI